MNFNPDVVQWNTPGEWKTCGPAAGGCCRGLAGCSPAAAPVRSDASLAALWRREVSTPPGKVLCYPTASQESIAAGSIFYHSWILCMAVLFYFSCLEEKAEKCSKSTQGSQWLLTVGCEITTVILQPFHRGKTSKKVSDRQTENRKVFFLEMKSKM